MNKTQPNMHHLPGAQKAPITGGENSDFLNVILHDVLQTREVRHLLMNLVAELMNIWAGQSRWKQRITKMAGFAVVKELSHPSDGSKKEKIKRLFEDEKVIQNTVELLSGLINAFSGALEAGGKTLALLSTEEKKNIFSNMIAQIGKGRTGGVVTSFARILNDIHKEDTEFLAHTITPGFKRWIESMDFGELKEMLENSGQDARAMVSMINNSIWEYPSKVVLLLSLIPTISNMLADVIHISVGKLNAVPPDLLTDIVLAFINEMDTNAVARVVDEVAEIVRKIHTGSALLGEPGNPRLPKVLADMVDGIISKTDPATFWKARVALAELKSSFNLKWSEVINNNPEYAQLRLVKTPEIFNIRMRTRNQKMAVWDTMDGRDLSLRMAQHLSAYDAQEVTEWFNAVLRMTNRVCGEKPGICSEFVRQFIEAVDHDELADLAGRIFKEMGEELRPVARAVVPGLVEWVCDSLKPDEDEFEDDVREARHALRQLLMSEEV
jgi:hypothetical protein